MIWSGVASGRIQTRIRFFIMILGYSHRMFVRASPLLHRMKSDHVPFRIEYQRDEPVLSDGKFFLVDFSTVIGSPFGLNGAIFAIKIHQSAVSSGRNP